MNERLLVIGGGLMQRPVVEVAKRMGLSVAVLDGNPHALARPLVDDFVACDIKDKDACLEAARSLHHDRPLSGVMTVGTDFSTTVSWIAQHLGLPGTPFGVAEKARDKGLMRRAFRSTGVSSPEFVELKALPNRAWEPPWGWPCVVKPSDNMGARGVRLVHGPADLASAIEDALAFSLSGSVLVEEYIEGPEYSLDAILEDGRLRRCGLADRTIAFPPHFVELGHSFPSTVSADRANALWDEFERAVVALGLRDGAAKGDVKWHPLRGPVIGEVAHRLSGGFMSGWTYPLTSGRSSIRWAVERALGRRCSEQPPESSRPVVERGWVGLPGRLIQIDGEAEARTIPGVEEVFLLTRAGALTEFPRNNVEKLGNVIASGTRSDAAANAARAALNRVRFRYDPHDGRTQAFLLQSNDHPWAFEQARGRQSRSAKDLAAQARDEGWVDWYGNTVTDCIEVLKEEGDFATASDACWRALLAGGVLGARVARDGRW